jgi:hypothetical protein
LRLSLVMKWQSFHFGLAGVVVLTLIPNPARAQGDMFRDAATKLIHKVGVHGNVSFRDPVDSDVTKGTTFGPSIGLSPGRTNGVKYPMGISMFSEDLHSANGEQFAVMKTWSIQAGIGYGWHFGLLSTSVGVQTGYSFNSGHIQGDTARAFDLPGGAVSIDVGNAWLLRPQVKAEYFLTPKFTLRVSGDYVLMHPDVTVTTPNGRVANRWDASNIHANVGVGWYPFRK